ncbi:hypothetical protein [Nocardia iowensis]|uniref:D-alanyl-D-alanine carboxypeptidase n=1 Tax=Nocardia iowensis TaxID=204891 RepID=A0ABX8RN95_NOCIO|nr:hypothetical protein [Nocardia iowensis]QXN89895.1 hypothetical protein KV110_31235 [Nocardia iowensis]
MSITITLTDQDKATLRTAAYGAVSLMSAAGAPHKAITHGSIALTSATGLVGHVLAAKTKDIHLPGKSVPELADHVLPALTAAMRLLGTQHPVEADNFRATVLVAIQAAAGTAKTQPNPAVTAMAHKITAALDA